MSENIEVLGAIPNAEGSITVRRYQDRIFPVTVESTPPAVFPAAYWPTVTELHVTPGGEIRHTYPCSFEPGPYDAPDDAYLAGVHVNLSSFGDHQDTSNADTAMTVTVEEAAKIAGVSARTVRRWINRGWLPCYDGANGKLVSPADLASAQAAARRGHGHDRDHADTTDTNTDTQANTRAATATDQAQRQLEVLSPRMTG
jgi:excisionase family DNA binding protein